MKQTKPAEQASIENLDSNSLDLDELLYARHAEINSLSDLQSQRGTTIPALFNTFYKFIQNPSSVSIETYKRMIDTDDTVGSGVDLLVTLLAARLGRYQHKDPEITKWVNDRLQEIAGGWFNCVKEVLSAAWAGFSVSEKVWANTPNGFVISKLVPLPPTTVLFETERSGELTSDGILQYQRNYNPFSLASGIGYFGGPLSNTGGSGFSFRPDAFAKFGDLPYPIRTANSYAYLSIRIPRQKCVHYAFDAQGKFGNPYGRSLLRRAYKYWVLKDAVLQMMATALDRKGTPLTVVYADGMVTLRSEDKGANANNPQANRGRSVGRSAVEEAAKAFANIHNDSTVILPGKKGSIFDLDFVAQDSNADVFIAALNHCDRSIMRALLLPSLIMTNGDGTGSYSLGQEHANTLQKILDGILQGVEQVLIQDVISDLLRYNFPKELWESDGFGGFGKRDFSQDELDKVMSTWEKAINNGVVDVNDLRDLNKMREALGFEEKTELQTVTAGGIAGPLGGDGLDE
jgi:hypothetical protein